MGPHTAVEVERVMSVGTAGDSGSPVDCLGPHREANHGSGAWQHHQNNVYSESRERTVGSCCCRHRLHLPRMGLQSPPMRLPDYRFDSAAGGDNRDTEDDCRVDSNVCRVRLLAGYHTPRKLL